MAEVTQKSPSCAKIIPKIDEPLVLKEVSCSAHYFEAMKTCTLGDSKVVKPVKLATHPRAAMNGSEGFAKSQRSNARNVGITVF